MELIQSSETELNVLAVFSSCGAGPLRVILVTLKHAVIMLLLHAPMVCVSTLPDLLCVTNGTALNNLGSDSLSCNARQYSVAILARCTVP